MANKREFKKYVDAIGASVIDEMIAAYYKCGEIRQRQDSGGDAESTVCNRPGQEQF